MVREARGLSNRRPLLILVYVLVSFSQPSIRGMLMAMAGIAATLGLFLVFLLGSLTAWRNVALVCFVVPVATLVAICFVSQPPASPPPFASSK